ncbi:MAG TPA: beta-ketoacyl synthase N-terminal-like domain-containing protein [Pyrinomonadaceae bacterium]|jgi:acyl transferase domain-containing protein/thioesterase domain-containing protein
MKDADRSGSIENSIAVVGMSGRWPGASHLDLFWKNLQEGVESITWFSDEELESANVPESLLKNPSYVKAGPVLEGIELFDASFFGMSPREAQLLDPQHRLFMECAWETLEAAGYDPEKYAGSIGVYAGVGCSTYMLSNLYPLMTSMGVMGLHEILQANEKDFLPVRVSYKLNLRGPSLSVSTGCSTSLVAIHLACQSLLNGECDMALAGGVFVRVQQKTGYLYQEGWPCPPDGHLRAFDAKAQGTIFGSGVGIVLLKRFRDALADGDDIQALIKGSAINNDGSAKVSFTAPSIEGQAEVIAEALAVAGVDPETITYIEAHGTGTRFGDPVEVAALTQAFRAYTKRKGFCAIGSVKTNIGHLDAAAGVTGFIKTVLALRDKRLPPSLNFDQPNPQIDFAGSPFYVNTKLRPWQAAPKPLRAGVSSFGVGGTNAHVILEEAPERAPSGPSRPSHLVVLSAKTSAALESATAQLADYLARNPEINLADVAYTLHVGRKTFSYRRMLVCQEAEQAASALQTLDPKQVVTHLQRPGYRPVVFMFPGGGAQYVQMGLELYQTERTFRQHVDMCAAGLMPHLGQDIRQVLYPEAEAVEECAKQLKRPALALPALFTVEYALAQLWMSWGIQPQSMIGHSLGEYVAACLSGVFTLEDALALVALRGRLAEKMAGGAMLSIPLAETEIKPLLGERLHLAAINGPSFCVVSGPVDEIEKMQTWLAEKGLEYSRLHINTAGHSEMLEPILEEFETMVGEVALKPPRIPYISNVTGTWMTQADATTPTYWTKHLRQTVRFGDGLQQLLGESANILLEVGPGNTLATLARQHPAKAKTQVVLSSLRHVRERQSDVAFMLKTLGRLWLAGTEVDWVSFYLSERRHRLRLPTYPFERQRYWIDSQSTSQHVSHHPGEGSRKPDETDLQAVPEPSMSTYQRPDCLNAYVPPETETERGLAVIWQDVLKIEPLGIHDNFFEMGGHSMLMIQLSARLRRTFQVNISLHRFLEGPTIAQLAVAIEEARHQQKELMTVSRTQDVLVRLQTKGSRRPFFCVHPAGGTVLCYAQLAHLLGTDQPFYALQAPDTHSDGDTEPRIEEMAACYLAEVRAIQPEGPYLLGGWSLGGNIAFEMANQLSEQGQEVALLAMFDSHPPATYNSQRDSGETNMLAAFIWVLSLYMGKKDPPVTCDELQALNPDEGWNYIKEQFEKKQVLPDGMEFQDVYGFYQRWKSHGLALRNYKPHRIYPNQLTLFQATEGHPEGLLGLTGVDLQRIDTQAWAALTSEPLAIYDVPGDHYTIVHQPHVQVLAQALTHCLEQAQRQARPLEVLRR